MQGDTMVSDAQFLQIVAELKSSSLTIAEASNVFQRIADFSFDEGNVAKFEEMGGFLALMDVMRTHRVSVEVSRSGCEIIGNISMINREDLNNAWQYIVIKAMQLHWRDRGISKWGSRAIGELAKNRDILGDMGACEMISRVTMRSTFQSTNVTALISSLIALHPKSMVKDLGEQALMRLAQ